MTFGPTFPWLRREVIGDCMLYLGDCLEVALALPDVDHFISDPPYEDHMHDSKRGRKTKIRKDGSADPKPLDFSSIGEMRQPVADHAQRLSNGWALAFCTPEGVAPWRDAFELSGSKYKRACLWVKPDSAPQFNGQGPAMGAEMFTASWCGKGHASWNAGGRRNVWTYACNPPTRTKLHPTEKPIELMCDLVQCFTNPGETILDMFMGSGTTLVACALRGRKAIGIEQKPEYFEAACQRVRDAYRSPDLFIEPPKLKIEQAELAV